MDTLNMSVLYQILVISILVILPSTYGIDISFTIDIPAGVMECFHQSLKQGTDYEVEYQVIDGGELDVNFLVSSPISRQTFITDFRKTGDVHKRTASEEGDYKFCIDNSFSHFANKVVYFELYANDEEGEDIDDAKLFGEVPEEDEQQLEMKIEVFKDSLSKIKERLQNSSQTQRTFATVELRDRSVQEHNFERVNFWSVINIIVMIVAGFINVYLIRSLFSQKRVSTKQRT